MLLLYSSNNSRRVIKSNNRCVQRVANRVKWAHVAYLRVVKCLVNIPNNTHHNRYNVKHSNNNIIKFPLSNTICSNRGFNSSIMHVNSHRCARDNRTHNQSTTGHKRDSPCSDKRSHRCNKA